MLALVYFFIQTIGASRQIILLASLPTFLLVVLNSLHARLIRIQHSWYSGIDEKLRELLEVEHVEHKKRLRFFGSTHEVYRSLHVAIATFLFLVAVAMLLYGLGFFPELQLPQGGGGGETGGG